MDFTLSDEQRMMQDSVRDLLAAECTVPQLRKLLDAGKTRDEARWKKLFELGLGGVLADEEQGGLDLREIDFALVAEECGRALLPEPLVEQAGIAVPLLSPSPALREREGPPKGEGEGRAAGEIAGRLRASPSSGSLRSPPSPAVQEKELHAVLGGEATIAVGHPANPFVVAADTADLLLLPHGDEVHLVDRNAVELTHQPGIDPFRRLFRVDWTPSPATRVAEAGTWPAAFERGALFAAAQGLGIAERAVEIATAYAQERQQFGKPIGSYQAIKHALATVQVKIAFARPVVYAAAELFYGDDLRSQTRVSHAKLAALDAADLACRTAIQIHGAMGYSWETDVHFYLKRALALAGAWGDRSFHRKRVTHRLFQTDLPLGPDQTFILKGDHHAA
jgi:alkylation response protein AidB-like acyl-CoA dehydrogenase